MKDLFELNGIELYKKQKDCLPCLKWLFGLSDYERGEGRTFLIIS